MMKAKYLIPTLMLLCSVTLSQAQEVRLFATKFEGLDREYRLFLPDSLDSHRPLVIMLHGYGGDSRNYPPELLTAAKKHGFALCIPQGWPAPADGQAGWNVRYPAQDGMKTNDIEFVRFLAGMLQQQFSLSHDATFLTGMSNGGEMCYAFARIHPETFTAIASVAGLTMEWLVREYDTPHKSIPFFEIHGTEDTVSLWEGDPEGKYGWGPYTSVRTAISNIIAQNKCTHETVTELPAKSPDSNRIVLHTYRGGTDGCEVRLYKVIGGGHSWMMDDIDTVEEIWSFFKKWMK